MEGFDDTETAQDDELMREIENTLQEDTPSVGVMRYVIPALVVGALIWLFMRVSNL